jgi:hypothetical protein
MSMPESQVKWISQNRVPSEVRKAVVTCFWAIPTRRERCDASRLQAVPCDPARLLVKDSRLVAVFLSKNVRNHDCSPEFSESVGCIQLVIWVKWVRLLDFLH